VNGRGRELGKVRTRQGLDGQDPDGESSDGEGANGGRKSHWRSFWGALFVCRAFGRADRFGVSDFRQTLVPFFPDGYNK